MVGAIDRTGAPLSQIITELGVSKQAAGQLVDTLVARGYLDRAPDPDDRRRLTITLTERGHAAAEVRSAVGRVDADLLRAVGADYVAHTRVTLGALAQAVVAVSPATVALNRGNISDSLMILLLVLAADAVSAAIAPGQPGPAGPGRGLDRARLPGQDDRGLAGAARVRPGLPGGARRDRSGGASASWPWPAWSPGWCRCPG